MNTFFKNLSETFGLILGKIKLFLKSTAEFTPPAKDKFMTFVIRWWHWVLGAIAAFILLYYPAGSLLTHRIDLSLKLNESAVFPASVSALKSVSERELVKHVYTPNLPFIFPAAVLDNMPAFQKGIFKEVAALTKVLSELNPNDVILSQAATSFSYPADVWYINKWKPAKNSAIQYKDGMTALTKYIQSIDSQNVNTSDAALKTLIATTRMTLKDNSERTERHISKNEKKFFDFKADDLFYFSKGQAYVAILFLRDLRKDFPEQFKNNQLNELMDEALFSLRKALSIHPLIVSNASPNTQFAPNHLLGQGFYLSRAQSALREMEALLP